MLNATKNGTASHLFPPHPGGPAHTLLLFAMGGQVTLTFEPYCLVGTLLHERGWNVVSLDLPCHGDDASVDEPNALACWAARIVAGEDIVAEFQQRVNDVIAHLVGAAVADPARIAAAGTSRGGFMAFHAAAANPLVRAIAAFAPVTDLIALTEFKGMRHNPVLKSIALKKSVDALADRASWIVIGSTDDRVGTHRTSAFFEALTKSARRRRLQPIGEMRVVAVPGHASLPEWHDWAAEWLESQLDQSGLKAPS